VSDQIDIPVDLLHGVFVVLREVPSDAAQPRTRPLNRVCFFLPEPFQYQQLELRSMI
jgi:hypothetical protein